MAISFRKNIANIVSEKYLFLRYFVRLLGDRAGQAVSEELG